MTSNHSHQDSTDSYFHSISEVKTDDENSSTSGSIEAEEENFPKVKETGLPSSTPPAAGSKSSGDHHQDVPTHNYARIVAYGLVGMIIDYNGDVLDATKKSCGKANGDITEMVGQKIDEDGLIRNKAGEVVGQVTQNYGLEEAVAAMMEAQKRAMGGNGSSGSREPRDRSKTFTEERKPNGSTEDQEKSQTLPNIWQGTVGDAAPGNDIHLNVQSTKEGISMSIRIPTLFMKEQHRQFEEENKANQPS